MPASLGANALARLALGWAGVVGGLPATAAPVGKHVNGTAVLVLRRYPNPSPIFVIGLPRSGSTLIEHILSSHSQVWGAGEWDKGQGEACRLGTCPSIGLPPVLCN